MSKELFTVKHSAKDVEYTIIGFSEKNKDEVSKGVVEAVTSSKNELVKLIYNKALKGEKISVKELKGKDKLTGYKFRK